MPGQTPGAHSRTPLSIPPYLSQQVLFRGVQLVEDAEQVSFVCLDPHCDLQDEDPSLTKHDAPAYDGVPTSLFHCKRFGKYRNKMKYCDAYRDGQDAGDSKVTLLTLQQRV